MWSVFSRKCDECQKSPLRPKNDRLQQKYHNEFYCLCSNRHFSSIFIKRSVAGFLQLLNFFWFWIKIKTSRFSPRSCVGWPFCQVSSTNRYVVHLGPKALCTPSSTVTRISVHLKEASIRFISHPQKSNMIKWHQIVVRLATSWTKYPLSQSAVVSFCWRSVGHPIKEGCMWRRNHNWSFNKKKHQKLFTAIWMTSITICCERKQWTRLHQLFMHTFSLHFSISILGT